MRKIIFLASIIFLSGCTIEPAPKDIMITYHFLSHRVPYTIWYTDEGKLLTTTVEEKLYYEIDAMAKIGRNIEARISNADTTFNIKIMVSYDDKAFAEQSGKKYVELKTTIPHDILER